MGMQVPGNRLVTRHVMPLEPGPIGFLSQSGGYADDLPFFGGPRGLRFSKLISYGNAIDMGESEILEALSDDPDTEIIAAYIEGVRDGKNFMKALREATARKPVVIQKGGRTEAGQRTAYSHTASMAGSIEVFDALCRQLNVIQVDDFDELMDMLVALRFTAYLPKGRGVAVIGTGGGASVMAGDEIEKAGLRMPPLSAEVQADLREFLAWTGGILTNPIDARNLIFADIIHKTLEYLGKLPDVDILIYHMGFHPISHWGDGRLSSPEFLKAAVEAFKQAQEATGKPVFLVLCPALDLQGMKEFLEAKEAFVNAGLPVFHSLHGAARTVARLVKWHKSRAE
jgi:acyl-CoA synthetase (NDP forming)